MAPQLQPPSRVSSPGHQLRSHPSTSWAFYLRAGQLLSWSNVFHGSLLPLIMTKSSSLGFKTFYEVSQPSSLPAPSLSFSVLSRSLIDTPRSSHPGCLAVPWHLGFPGDTEFLPWCGGSPTPFPGHMMKLVHFPLAPVSAPQLPGAPYQIFHQDQVQGGHQIHS